MGKFSEKIRNIWTGFISQRTCLIRLRTGLIRAQIKPVRQRMKLILRSYVVLLNYPFNKYIFTNAALLALGKHQSCELQNNIFFIIYMRMKILVFSQSYYEKLQNNQHAIYIYILQLGKHTPNI